MYMLDLFNSSYGDCQCEFAERKVCLCISRTSLHIANVRDWCDRVQLETACFRQLLHPSGFLTQAKPTKCFSLKEQGSLNLLGFYDTTAAFTFHPNDKTILTLFCSHWMTQNKTVQVLTNCNHEEGVSKLSGCLLTLWLTKEFLNAGGCGIVQQSNRRST